MLFLNTPGSSISSRPPVCFFFSVIALAKELLPLIRKFRHFYRLIFLSPVEESLKRFLGLCGEGYKIPELGMGN